MDFQQHRKDSQSRSGERSGQSFIIVYATSRGKKKGKRWPWAKLLIWLRCLARQRYTRDEARHGGGLWINCDHPGFLQCTEISAHGSSRFSPSPEKQPLLPGSNMHPYFQQQNALPSELLWRLRKLWRSTGRETTVNHRNVSRVSTAPQQW